MEDNLPDSNSVSRYNEAQSQIFRLSKLWEQSHQAFLDGNPKKMYWILTRIWTELYPDAVRQRNKEAYLKEYSDISKGIKIGFDENRKDILFFYCQKLELFLKDLQCAVGKGSAYADDSSRMF